MKRLEFKGLFPPFDDPDHEYWKIPKLTKFNGWLGLGELSRRNAKLKVSPGKRNKIRKLHMRAREVANKYSVKQLARRFKVSESAIRKIINQVQI